MGGDGEEMRVNRTHRAVRAPPKLSLHIPTVHTSLTSTDSFCFLWMCLSASSGCQNSLCSLRKKAGSIRRLTLLLCPAALQQQPRGSDVEVPYLSSSSGLTKSHVLHWRPEFPSRIKHQVFWGDLPNKLLVLKSLFRFCFCSSVWSTPLQLNSAPGKVVRNRWRFWLSVTETLGCSWKHIRMLKAIPFWVMQARSSQPSFPVPKPHYLWKVSDHGCPPKVIRVSNAHPYTVASYFPSDRESYGPVSLTEMHRQKHNQ